MSFSKRVQNLPHLGIGVSTEYGAFQGSDSLDIMALRQAHPQFAQFLEVGVELEKGLDEDTQAWIERGGATTFHFLDVNLDDPDDFGESWLRGIRETAKILKPAWMCGDAGLWHLGPRERGSMLLLPPICAPDAVSPMAEGIQRLREEVGLEVLPENPPGSIFLGSLHLLDFFARVIDEADTGFLLDCAHLAIYQKLKGLAPTTGLDQFPLDKVIEIHVAGAHIQSVDGLSFVEDNHTPNVLPETWEILEYVVPRATELRATVFECERNPMETTLSGFQRIQRTLSPHFGGII